MNNSLKVIQGKYDYLIIGAGLYGAVMARELTDSGRSVLVLEKREHTGGNCYTEKTDGITVHKYGPHIFHTDNEAVWRYVNRFARFNEFTNRPVTVSGARRYPLPLNMDTFYELWGITDPAEAEARIRAQAEGFLQGKEPSNFEEQAVSMAGTDIYGKIIKGYSMKHWGRDCRDLPASIIKRLRISFDHDGDYYGERHEGIPAEGYTSMIDNMLKGITVITGVDYEDPDVRETAGNIADRIIYTGSIDSYYSYCFGTLEYRSVRFDEIRLDGIEFYQDRAVVNNADPGTAYTRETEHRYFDPESCRKELGFTIVSREFPEEYDGHNEAMYPLRDERNLSLYRRYRELANDDPKLFFGGRLGTYRYLDMDDVIESALADSAELLKKNASENNSK